MIVELRNEITMPSGWENTIEASEDVFEDPIQVDDDGLKNSIEASDNGLDVVPQPNYLDYSKYFITTEIYWIIID